MSANRNLIVLRCGDESLHPGWMGPDRNWDLAVSYFGPRDDRQFPEAEYTHRFKGGKWNGIFAFFQAYPETLKNYDFFWLPDDDIETSCEPITKMFQTVAKEQLELAQPSLSRGSYLSHLITLNNPWFAYRRVNFIELMVPVLSQKLLIKTLPLFEATRTGFGMDYVWHRFTSDPNHKVAIIDNVEVRHTRPVGGALHKMIKAQGHTTATQEQAIFLEPYGDCGTPQVIFGGLLRNGLDIRSPFMARLIALGGWSTRASGNLRSTERLPARRFLSWIAGSFIKRMFKPVFLTPIDPIPGQAGSMPEARS